MSPRQSDGGDSGDIAILGGGLAGLSLALQLLDHGVTRPITILEPREHYTDDRTWCFWATDDHPFAEAVTQRWPAWRVTTPEQGAVTCRSARYPYCRLPSGAVYDLAERRLAAAPNVTLRRGVRVKDVWREAGGRLAIITDAGVHGADLAFDGRPPAPGSWPLQGHPFLWQDFLGWRVEARPGTFDPETVDLMDFHEGAPDGVRFLYVLPLSDQEAMLETTAFTQAPPGQPRHARVLEAALAARCGRFAAVTAREQGRIPMTSAPPPVQAHDNLIPIGTRAGAPRPSTGYAFLAIQRHSRALAARVAAGRPSALPVRSGLTRWLDQVFLTRVLEAPEAAPGLFHRMFEQTPPDRIVRFLSERGGVIDHLAVMASLPTLPFLRTALGVRPSLGGVAPSRPRTSAR
jgi:lycopene beta-cyclase